MISNGHMQKKNIHEFPDWLNWLEFNLQRQCNPNELEDILHLNHFSTESIRLALNTAKSQAIDYLALSRPYFTHEHYPYHVQQAKTGKLQLYLIDDFLTVHECNLLIELSKKILVPSTLTIPSADQEFRTSQTANIKPEDGSITSIVDAKITACLGIDGEYAEPTQIQCYQAGQQFKMHTDFFEPNTAEYLEFAGDRGNRTWTFMVYLNDVAQGGETIFPAIEYTIKPKQGLAVIWNNRHPNGDVNHDSLHAGLPVIDGEKFIITKWYRERKAC